MALANQLTEKRRQTAKIQCIVHSHSKSTHALGHSHRHRYLYLCGPTGKTNQDGQVGLGSGRSAVLLPVIYVRAVVAAIDGADVDVVVEERRKGHIVDQLAKTSPEVAVKGRQEEEGVMGGCGSRRRRRSGGNHWLGTERQTARPERVELFNCQLL